MNQFATYFLLAACAMGVQVALTHTASAASGCRRGQVYNSRMGQCIPREAGASTKVFIPHGCPYNLDKSCMKTPSGRLVQCHCVS